MKKNILILAPHADDEILGCGGAISKYKNLGTIPCSYSDKCEYRSS